MELLVGRLISIHEKERLASFLMRNKEANVLAIGDLDAFFWPSTVWWGWEEGDELLGLALLYCGAGLPVLLLSSEIHQLHTQDFVNALTALLPQAVYAHLSPGVDQLFSDLYQLVPHGRHLKMVFRHPEKIQDIDTSDVAPLNREHLSAIEKLFSSAYPGNFFDVRMLDTNLYYGIWADGTLLCAAGIHTYSPQYGVAAIGNVTTLPEMRGKGLATKVCARLLSVLQTNVDIIALNVKADNAPAIQVYQRLGFETVGEYDECEMYRRRGADGC
jgi:RimJ/RimL family protein N-acetyltransferase